MDRNILRAAREDPRRPLQSNQRHLEKPSGDAYKTTDSMEDIQFVNHSSARRIEGHVSPGPEPISTGGVLSGPNISGQTKASLTCLEVMETHGFVDLLEPDTSPSTSFQLSSTEADRVWYGDASRLAPWDHFDVSRELWIAFSRAYVYQQDNDPNHTSLHVRNWFHRRRVDVLDWPSQSPDLNPIEHLWEELERRLKGVRATNVDQKSAQLEAAWKTIPLSVVDTLLDSMPRRCQAVIDVKGFATKY
uniref:DDE_3 domain-containing protein n=1 Tax=Caenorhabditis japonica TaxID=281687 RepID=A0A8R1IF70_CAEJA